MTSEQDRPMLFICRECYGVYTSPPPHHDLAWTVSALDGSVQQRPLGWVRVIEDGEQVGWTCGHRPLGAV